ncbi:right-handed parallel beta-helix repeat-containing protein [Priestia megaterium]
MADFISRGLAKSNQDKITVLSDIATVVSRGSDDTATLQSAINSAKTILLDPNSTYNVNELALKSNIVIDGRGATLFFKNGQSAIKSVLKGTQCKNILIKNLVIDGNKASNGTNTGAQDGGNHGISLLSCDNITLQNVQTLRNGTDGIYLGEIGGVPCTNIKIEDVISDGNMRQGMSLINVLGVHVLRSQFINTAGKLPEAGIDIEPNSTVTAKNIKFEKCVISNNAGRGFVLQNQGSCENLQLIDCEIRNNVKEGLRFTGVGTVKSLKVNRAVVMDNGLENWFGVDSNLVFDSCEISNVESNKRFKLQNMNKTLVSNNKINVTDATVASIVLISGSTYTIVDNDISGGKYGIDIFDASINDNDIHRNKIQSSDRCIYMRSSNNKASNNRLNSTASYGIEVTGTKNMLNHNNITTVTNAGARLSSTALNNSVTFNFVNVDVANSGGVTNDVASNKVVV